MTEERKALERLVCRGVITVLTVVGVWLLAPLCWNYLSPFIIAVPVAAMLSPLTHVLERRMKIPRAPAVLIPVLLLCSVLVALIYWFASFGINQMMNVLNNSSSIINDLVTSIRAGFDSVLRLLDADALSPDMVQWLRTSMNSLLSGLTQQLSGLAKSGVGITVNMATGIPYALIYANFLIMGIYFVTKDYDNIRSMLPGGRRHDPNSSATKLTNSAVVGLVGYLRMQTTYGLLSLITGTIYFECFGFKYSFLIALVAATFEFLPLFGNGTLYIPWSIIAFILGDTRTGTLVIVLYAVFITMRRITEPKLLSNSIGVSPFASLVGMFVGLKAGGILGLIGGPVVMSVLSGVWQGHYLDPTIRDCKLIIDYLKRRWQPSDEVAKMRVQTIFDRKPEQNEKRRREPLRTRRMKSRK